MRARSSLFAALALSVAIGAVCVTIAEGGGSAGSRPASAPSAAVTDSVPTISLTAKQEMAQDGDVLQPVNASSVAGALTEPAGIAAAQESLNFLKGCPVISATLASLTDLDLTSTDPSEPRPVDNVPDLSNRAVWVVVFKNAAAPVFGKIPDQGQTASPQVSVSDWWVAVDAVTGKMLVAASIG